MEREFKMSDYKIEQLNANNIDDLMQLEKECFFGDLAEPKEPFLVIAKKYPKGALLLYCGEEIVGSLFFYPYFEGKVNDFDSAEINDSGDEDCMYLHSFSIHPDFRGKGLAHLLFDHFDKVSLEEGYDLQALAATQSSERFWMRYDFRPVRQICHGNTLSTYMTRKTFRKQTGSVVRNR